MLGILPSKLLLTIIEKLIKIAIDFFTAKVKFIYSHDNDFFESFYKAQKKEFLLILGDLFIEKNIIRCKRQIGLQIEIGCDCES